MTIGVNRDFYNYELLKPRRKLVGRNMGLARGPEGQLIIMPWIEAVNLAKPESPGQSLSSFARLLTKSIYSCGFRIGSRWVYGDRCASVMLHLKLRPRPRSLSAVNQVSFPRSDL